MRSTTPVSLCKFQYRAGEYVRLIFLDPAVYYAHIASLRARAHENVPASDKPRGGAKFVEQRQDESNQAATLIGRAVSSVKSEFDRHTEVLPLVELGVAANPAQKATIKYTMWYI
jgi:eukaryotic translation initiation factor 2C